MLDAELNGLAVLALKNALFRKLQRVMTAHFAAAEGLIFVSEQFYEVQAFPNKDVDPRDEAYNMYTAWAGGVTGRATCGQRNLVEAFDDDRAEEIWLEGRKVFERRDGKWHYVENEHEQKS